MIKRGYDKNIEFWKNKEAIFFVMASLLDDE